MASLKDIGIQRWRRRQRASAADHAVSIADQAIQQSVAGVVEGVIEDMDWPQLEEFVTHSPRCTSCAQTSPILGEGNIEADWFFIIDAPSRRDLDSGTLLSGRSGQLFSNILAALGTRREDVYLSSVCKCVRDQDASQLPECAKVIHRQIALIEPKLVFAFGEITARAVLKANDALDVLRAQPQSCHINKLPVVPSFALPEVLREPILKAGMWQDLKKALSYLPG